MKSGRDKTKRKVVGKLQNMEGVNNKRLGGKRRTEAGAEGERDRKGGRRERKLAEVKGRMEAW